MRSITNWLRLVILGSLCLSFWPSPRSAALAQTEQPGTTDQLQSEPSSTGADQLYLPLVVRTVPSALGVTVRSGQTFITWPERTDLSGEHYRVYRSSGPISAANLSRAVLLAEVGKDSARFYANRFKYTTSAGEGWRPRYVDRYVLEDGGQPLPEGKGLLVWTVSADDFGGATSGFAYYAVTVIPAGKAEQFDERDTVGPVFEQVEDPLPVEITQSAGIDPAVGGHVYIQYMDLRHWNPTFHVPNWTNHYYGLDSRNPLFLSSLQYAYDYVVYEPDPHYCGSSLPASLPLLVYLHGWKDFDYPAPNSNPQPYCAYVLMPVDVTNTWYFGFARNHDYRLGSEVAAGDVIENYTERRVLRMVYDVQRNPPGPAAVDAQRIYVVGQSMGGTGALAFALRYPNVFATSYASQPLTNFRTAQPTHENWQDDAALKWGKPGLNLPVAISAPAGWADRLQAYNGTGAWDWEDSQKNLVSRMGDEIAPLGVAFAMNDHVLKYDTQGQPTLPDLDSSDRAWGGALSSNNHQWEYYEGLPPSLGKKSNLPFWNFSVIRDETVPGLSHLSSNLPLPYLYTATAPTSPYYYYFNQTVKWSSSWDPWAGAPVDQTDRWEMSLCSLAAGSLSCGGSSQTVDITPRRLQNFSVQPDVLYQWENQRVSDHAVIAQGYVMADSHGLLTVRGFAVTPGGNRLVLVPYTNLDTLDQAAFIPYISKP